MIEALIHLLIVVIVVGVVALLIAYLIDMLPIDHKFRQIARVLVAIIAVLIIIARALPLLGYSA